MRFTIKRDGIPVKDRGSVVYVADCEATALQNAKIDFANELQRRGEYREFYEEYYKTSCNAAWEVYQID